MSDTAPGGPTSEPANDVSRPTCAIVSFRLGLTDGVSIVARAWAESLTTIGFDVVTVAGDGPVDITVEGLSIGAPSPPDRDQLEAALAGVDLVVVENLCTIPLNLPAAAMVAEVLAGRPAIMHHHDPPWQRERFAHITELPPDDPAWRHVTINRLTEAEMEERGLQAVTIYNGFDVHEPAGDRAGTRAMLDVSADELLVAHPVRAIARKNIPAAVALCEELGATYWLLGAAEEGYDEELARILDAATCRVVRQSMPHCSDIYAAPDAIAFPSLWEGFGNPPIEAAIHRTPAVVGHYAVAEELRTLGFRWFDPDDAAGLQRWLDNPDTELLDHNQQLAEQHFSFEHMTDQLHELITAAGWLT